MYLLLLNFNFFWFFINCRRKLFWGWWSIWYFWSCLSQFLNLWLGWGSSLSRGSLRSNGSRELVVLLGGSLLLLVVVVEERSHFDNLLLYLVWLLSFELNLQLVVHERQGHALLELNQV